MVDLRANTNETVLVWLGTAQHVVCFLCSTFPLYFSSLTVLLEVFNIYGFIILCSKYWTFPIYIEYVDDVNTPLIPPFLHTTGTTLLSVVGDASLTPLVSNALLMRLSL